MYHPPQAQKAAPKAFKAKGLAQGQQSGLPPVSAYEKYSQVVPQSVVDAMNMGGALRGGTFVLLHDGTTVIGDGCLPYYYRINQLRVFNPAV